MITGAKKVAWGTSALLATMLIAAGCGGGSANTVAPPAKPVTSNPNGGLVQPKPDVVATDPQAKIDGELIVSAAIKIGQDDPQGGDVLRGANPPSVADLVQALTDDARLAHQIHSLVPYSNLASHCSSCYSEFQGLNLDDSGDIEFSPGTVPKDDLSPDPAGGFDYLLQVGSPYGGAGIVTYHMILQSDGQTWLLVAASD